jgi:hypothetical protein
MVTKASLAYNKYSQNEDFFPFPHPKLTLEYHPDLPGDHPKLTPCSNVPKNYQSHKNI